MELREFLVIKHVSWYKNYAESVGIKRVNTVSSTYYRDTVIAMHWHIRKWRESNASHFYPTLGNSIC